MDRWRFTPGQLVILDEASLAGTRELDRIVGLARAAGAKVLLVGDWAQLAAVDAGGAFAMLAHDRPDVAELLDVHRFTHDWEKTASLQLRAGDPAVIHTYLEHGRVHDGPRDAMLDVAYTAWLTDQNRGLRSLLLAADTATVTDLNHRAHHDLVAAGLVSADGVTLADGTTAGIGDRIVTRHNDRHTTTRDATGANAWVKNGDEWTITDHGADGSLTVQRHDQTAATTLTADYVREHVELAYATTAHRAQGRTVDTAHALLTNPATTREALYVLLTRGRDSNHTYLATDHETDPNTAHGHDNDIRPQDLLAAVIKNVGAEPSAHEILRRAGHEAAGARDQAIHSRTLARTTFERELELEKPISPER